MKIKKIITDLKNALLDEFSSVRLAITLFTLLAICTLIGTILPEEPMIGKGELIKKYGLEKYHILKSLGLTDVFHSWWYMALLTAFAINIIVASFRRVFPKCKLAFSWPVPLNEKRIKKLSINSEVNANGSLSLNALKEKLTKKNYKSKIVNENLLLAVKGGWHRTGASVTHVGILILLVGAAISTLTGFNGMAQISPQEGFYVADLGQNLEQVRSIEKNNWLAPISKMPIWFGKVPPYLVKVNDTWRKNYKTGQPKQWYSDISIFNTNKKELTRKIISVNHPLEFMGLDIYQSNWGKFLKVSFNKEQLSLPLENFMNEEVVFIPLSEDVGLKLKIMRSDILELYAISREKNLKEKLIGKINHNQNLQVGPINIGYYGTETLTGLQFKSNPGSFLIYPGLVLIIIGVFIAFGSRKQIWAFLNKESNKITIGGNSDRMRDRFYKEFEDIVKEIVHSS